MSQIFKTVLECMTGRGASPEITEKAPLRRYEDSPQRITQDVANDFLATLYGAEELGPSLQLKLQDVVSECGWTESLASAILNALEAALRDGAPMGQAMKDASDRAVEAAGKILGLVKEFEHNHPELFWSLVAVGILAVIAPWALEVLGFGELGPVGGSFAAWWQARFLGYVPKGSWFSFFQRLGMVWRNHVAVQGYLM